MPTNIDGTKISSATIDGTEVTEITVDGSVVYRAFNQVDNQLTSLPTGWTQYNESSGADDEFAYWDMPDYSSDEDWLLRYDIRIDNQNTSQWHEWGISVNDNPWDESFDNSIWIQGNYEKDSTSYNEGKWQLSEYVNGSETVLYNNSGGRGEVSEPFDGRFELSYRASDGAWRARLVNDSGNAPTSRYDSGWQTGASTTPAKYNHLWVNAEGTNSLSSLTYDSANDLIHAHCERDFGPNLDVYYYDYQILNQQI